MSIPVTAATNTSHTRSIDVPGVGNPCSMFHFNITGDEAPVFRERGGISRRVAPFCNSNNCLFFFCTLVDERRWGGWIEKQGRIGRR